VSVLDSGFMLGDGLWEGMRLHKGVLAFAKPHLARLYEGAKALDMDLGASPKQLLAMIYATIDANGMGAASGVHIRLMVSRGLKPTPYQNPKITLGKVCVCLWGVCGGGGGVLGGPSGAASTGYCAGIAA
jgi:branched-chain amino acid aminotransferase